MLHKIISNNIYYDKNYYRKNVEEIGKSIKNENLSIDDFINVGEKGKLSLKIVFLLELLSQLGFNDIFSKSVVKVDYVSGWNYLFKKRRSIPILFERCRLKFDGDISNENVRQGFMRFINDRLNSVMGFELKSFNGHCQNKKIVSCIVDDLETKYNCIY